MRACIVAVFIATILLARMQHAGKIISHVPYFPRLHAGRVKRIAEQTFPPLHRYAPQVIGAGIIQICESGKSNLKLLSALDTIDGKISVYGCHSVETELFRKINKT